MVKIAIEFLVDHPPAWESAAQWLFETWYRPAGLTLTAAQFEIRQRLQADCVPLTLVALADGLPVGMASLVFDLPPDSKQRIVFLAGVYVLPDWRTRGIGRGLCERAAREARRIGLTKLALYTPDRADFYRGLGWQEKPLGTQLPGRRPETYMQRAV